MAEPIRVELTLDLDKHLAHGYRQTGEDDYERVPATVESLIIDAAARQMFDKARTSSEHSDIYNNLKSRVREIRDEEIRAALAPTIAEALAGGVQPTNSMGEPKGEPVTLRELILGEARVEIKRLVEQKSDSFSRRPGRTALQAMVADEVGAAFQKELKQAIDAAKAEVVRAVRAQAAAVLTETLQRAAENR